MATKDIFDAIGLGTPFYLAAATYGFFHWLDRSASLRATRAISAWLKGHSYRQYDLKMAVIAVFDRLYTSRILSGKGFIRSITISLTIWIIF
jgi:hypothetical protein